MRFTRQTLLVLLVCIYNAQLTQSLPNWLRWGKLRNAVFRTGRPLDASFRSSLGLGWKALIFRGGSSSDRNIPQSEDEEAHTAEGLGKEIQSGAASSVETPVVLIPASTRSTLKKSRHSSDMILDLRRRSSVSDNDEESLALRQLITSRAQDYINDIREAIDANESKLPNPRKLLHYLAPKVPAIKQSPDVNLRIHSARSDMDSGVAACIIGTLAHVCEIYDKETMQRAHSSAEKPRSAAPKITTDRRFEQLVECLLSGVNVKQRKRESLDRRLDKSDEEVPDIEDLLDEADAQEDEGLNIRDACRAAWGIAILGAHHLGTLGDVKVLDLLLALSLRIRELLLARLQLLRQDDLFSDASTAGTTTEERLDELAEELAEDAVYAMWTFACVRACTGLRSVPLFETCCSILCQDPVDMRRRAQEADFENGKHNIGTSDVIDRLARSELEEEIRSGESANSTKASNNAEQITEKDALLDWLSPKEVNDILWSLAVHGSSNSTSTSDEITLSETASTLREIAFDRLAGWLEEDLKLTADNRREHVLAVHTKDQKMTVAVVDAATLLASQHTPASDLSETFRENMPIESITLKSSQQTSTGEVQQVEVVDAAALLASIEDGGPIEVETEVMMAPTSLIDASESEIESPPQASESGIGGEDSVRMTSEMGKTSKDAETSKTPVFSAHDLASIAWSATELMDPLRIRVVGNVVELVARLGPSGTKHLTGGDLANLAWAISRFEADSDTPSSLSLSIVCWVAHSALQKVVNAHSEETDLANFRVLQTFQPPELGRMMWALARITSIYSQKPDEVRRDENIKGLARLALKAASSNLSLFATEDLLRVCWAFLEICGTEPAVLDTPVAVALGRILATVEQSLHRWERGDCQSLSRDNSSSSLGDDVSLFSSFFGRPRVNQPLLEQMLSDHGDDDDSVLAPLLEKSRRPLLRDLSVDPSTLCKAACAFQRLSVEHPHIKGGWTLTRVAIRLLCSKDARLMRECSIHDIVRLCEAAVRSDAYGHGRELITGLFAHKVVQVLNESLEQGGVAKIDSSIDFTEASPSEISILLWALGELGTKHTLNDEARQSAYKKMHLVAVTPFLTRDQVKSLDVSSAMKLLRGMVLMKFSSSDQMLLLLVLKEVQTKVTNLKSVAELCSLAETLALLKDALQPNDLASDTGAETSIDKKAKDETDGKQSLSETTQELSSQDEESVIPVDHSAIDEEMKYACNELLVSVADQAKEMTAKLTAQDIRRLLAVYSLLPFQADDLINHLEEEISKRLSYLEGSASGSLENWLKRAKYKSDSVNSILFEDTESSRFDHIKNGIMSLFRASDVNESADEKGGENGLPEELATMIQESIALTSKAANRAEVMRNALRVSLDSILNGLNEGTSFELGRCQELIENYRRVEFSTGTLRSRYDKERRKDIAKRVLSRLLP